MNKTKAVIEAEVREYALKLKKDRGGINSELGCDLESGRIERILKVLAF